MESIKEILDRLCLFYEVPNNRKLSEIIEINYNTISTWIKRESIPYDKLHKIVQKESISFDWLLTGKGEMLLSDTSEPTAPSNNHCFEIDMLNAKAGAGGGIYNYEVEVIDKIVLDKAFFRNTPDVNKVKIIEVDGDSMEPTLYNGDFIIIDESKTNKIDGIYAIQLDGQLLVKRLEFNLDNTITIISDNKRYSSKIYNPTETQIPFHLIGMKTLSIKR